MRVLLLSILFAALGGCSFSLIDSTDGDDGNSRWTLADGACPGLGSCALDVPTALGAELRFSIDLGDRSVAELMPVFVDEADGTITDVSRDTEDSIIRFSARPARAGTLELQIVDPDGERVDSTRFDVVTPTSLSCGQLPEGEALHYEMDALVYTDELTLLNGDSAPQLACLLTDADGAPLLSADIVAWRVLGDGDVIRVQDELIDFEPDQAARGARIWITPASLEASGVATIEASFGDQTERFTVTVE